MANEYLKRTPTSTGNRKVWSLAFWLKKPSKVTQNPIFNGANTAAGSHGLLWRYQSGGPFDIFEYNSSSTTWQLATAQPFRDDSSWYNVLLSVDTTKSTSSERVKLYFNGILITNFTTAVYPSQNYEGYVNSTVAHYFNAQQFAGTINKYGDGQYFDVFFVDGQALTPEVFGYYKKGDGYISAGSTQATDFKKGQWVPKAPKVIKSVINARGGFGVNGFYLPMNDSTNFGADLHCTPNSIITLKGEDEPQPYYGAPTTTDAYVSQLREDPYKDYLVLAIPGISTATGPNLITNGTFENGLTGWTQNNEGGGTSTVSNNQLSLYTPTTSSEEGRVYQQISVTSGQRYTLSFDTTSSTLVQVSNTIGGYEVANQSFGAGQANLSFTATASNHYIELRRFAAGTSVIDNVVVRQEDAPRDYSADIKGSGSNKTLTANGNAGVGYEIPSYYGSALSSNADGGFRCESTDFAFGTGDFTIEGWFYVKDSSVIRCIFDTRLTDNNANGLFVGINDNDNFYTYGFPAGVGVQDMGIPATEQWHHFAVVRNGSTGLVYLNGVCIKTQSMAATNYTDAGGTLMRPANVFGSLYSFYGNVQDLRVYKGVAKYKSGFDVPKPYTPVGIATWRAVPDCTANNFATLNPLIKDLSLSNGNLTSSESAARPAALATLKPSTGKWYYEVIFSTGAIPHIGLFDEPQFNTSSNTSSYVRLTDAQDIGLTGGPFIASIGDVVQCAIDFDNEELKLSKNGTGYTTYTFDNTNASNCTMGFLYQGTINFGQNPTFSGNTTAGTFTDSNGKGLFKYQPPEGFLALCEDNLPTPAIKDPGKHFKTVLYSGSGNTNNITSVGFKPDFIWIKERTSTSSNQLMDSVRGIDYVLYSNATNVEFSRITQAGSTFSSTDSGFSIGTNDTGINESGQNYVAWCWKAGGAAVSNTDGSINSVVSVNQDAGFSIVSYGGNSTDNATVGHGLAKTPSFILLKNRNFTNSWRVYHSHFGTNTGQTLYLELTAAAANDNNNIGIVNDTTFDVGYQGSNRSLNSTGDNYIAYCWTEIEGFSKFGSYIGNASADGPFVYCGFKPAFVMYKVASGGTGDWEIHDSSRASTNPSDKRLYANLSIVEGSGDAQVDFLSNGFKIRTNFNNVNASGATIIFAAWAESPFQTANSK